MATAMASANMDDLIGALSGNVHVSQDGYDIKALQEYLAATISMPNVNLSPTATFRPLPSSRSASSSRKHGLYQPQLQHAHAHGYMSDVASSSASTAYPGSYPAPYPAYPSPSLALSNNINGFWNSAEDVSIQAAMQKQMAPQRPGALRRTSSYSSYPAPAHAAEGYSFGDDAFAPLCQQPATGYEKPNPWAGFNGTSSAFGFGQKAQAVQEREQQHQQHQQQQQQAWGREEDDEMMDEDWAERDVDELDDESSVEEVMGIGGAGEEYDTGYGAWERGRRKD